MTIRGEDGETVAEFTIPVGVIIRAWNQDNDETMYDWICDSGRDSDELFQSIEEASRDARDSLGGY